MHTHMYVSTIYRPAKPAAAIHTAIQCEQVRLPRLRGLDRRREHRVPAAELVVAPVIYIYVYIYIYTRDETVSNMNVRPYLEQHAHIEHYGR
jgi:hypothetical protein